MHRSSLMISLQRQIFANRTLTPAVTSRVTRPPCDVFINHRGPDTKRTVVTLLYDYLSQLNLRPFLDKKNMKPGDKLFEKIDAAVLGCKVGVAVFSPRYCQSYFCLHELALMVESQKKVIPIFCDVKPSELRAVDVNGSCNAADLRRFDSALEEAKHTVGLAFDSARGNWSDVVTSAADIVIKSLIEVEDEQQQRMQQNTRENILRLPFHHR
ncbi:probable 2' cyclic ADP-D-ribose synthase BdTIR [Malania oleifera]|uniref:probable 2' cyclic ADP-D-ribose synthase BdTIR n=1 Tax=Malania oleifera TaxID=397392 RepID=UPI0025ADD664|nr:probable 2' cyclic ADP-D-ribose synthase BdTIR [Malania oleifera]